jgi:hypothetical protein
MLQLSKLRELPRWKKRLAVLLLVLALFRGYQHLAGRGVVPPVPVPGVLPVAALASPQDAPVYLAARQFVEALVADDREKVTAMLTEGHRANWTDASFLYDRTGLEAGRTMELGRFRHSVVRYVQAPDLGGETVALVTARYTVLFKYGDTVEGETQVQEEMVLQRVGDLWLIAADRRTIK